VALLIEVAVLLREDLLVLVEEGAELIELALLQNLEAVESACYLVRGWDLRHFGDRLVEKVVLSLDKSVIVPQHMFHLLNRGVTSICQCVVVLISVECARDVVS